MARKKNRPVPKPAPTAQIDAPQINRGAIRIRAAIIVLAGILTYWNSLSGPFILDDQGAIVENASIRQLSPLSAVLFPPANSSVAGRPVVNLSFAANYALGGLDVRGYHVWNLAVHLICALLAFGIVRRTLDLPRVRDRLTASSSNLAFAVALVWTLHPLNTEVVDYLTQRSESMMAAFFLLVLYSAIRAIEPRRSAMWRWGAVVACGLGMACKESMATAPVMVALFDRTYLFDSWKQALRARRGLYAGLAATWIVAAALMRSGPRSEVVGLSSGVAVTTYLMNQTEMIARYLRLAVWPRSLVVFYGWPVPVTLGDVMPYALVIGLLLVVTAIALVRRPMVGFLGAWFFVTLAPASSVVPIATEVGAERRMYLPLLALIALAVVGASALSFLVARPQRAAGRPPRLGFITAALMLTGVSLALAAGTVARNRDYASRLTLARTVVERRPTAIAHHILAEQLTQAGLNDEAVTHLREAVAGGDSKANYSLGIALFNQGKADEAVEPLRAFVATWNLPYRLVPHWLEPVREEIVMARVVLARAFSLKQRWPEAAEQANLVLKMAPSNLDARGLLADVLLAQERYEDATVHYRQYLELRPNDVHALTNLGVTLVAAEQMDDAVAVFRRAVGADPRDSRARRVLLMALLDKGDVYEAAREAREAVAVLPDDLSVRELVDRALDAERHLPRSKRARP